jgi:hypothetical protein
MINHPSCSVNLLRNSTPIVGLISATKRSLCKANHIVHQVLPSCLGHFGFAANLATGGLIFLWWCLSHYKKNRENNGLFGDFSLPDLICMFLFIADETHLAKKTDKFINLRIFIC